MMSLLRLLPLHTLVAIVRQVVKQPPTPIVEGSPQVKCTRVEGLEILPLEVSVLQVFYMYAQQCPGSQLRECWVALQPHCPCNIAGSGLGPTTWLRRNLTVKAEHQEKKEGVNDASVYSVAALSVLAELLAPLLYVLYVFEKDKVVPLTAHQHHGPRGALPVRPHVSNKNIRK
ncbi:Protein dopey-1 [Chionoecetes opilio]|uniref:Protein dopey-1 n=1 Tax=Chionoecetes opilio TaxID=41210 RepID=A0A8J5D1K3_CHIOP|nr:Protein dopey-1 [Chionoecetes opilio]